MAGTMPPNLHEALRSGDAAAVLALARRLVALGADVGDLDVGGSSRRAEVWVKALRMAARQGQVVEIYALVELGVQVEAKNKVGATPLHLAAREGQVAAIHALVELGADMEAKNKVGDTPLHVAAANGGLGAIYALVGLGAHKEAKSDYDATAAHGGRPRAGGGDAGASGAGR